ncbi:MAG: hypothetical protein LC660_03160 [Desulfobacteraceae bacterium]|nr:hypothetical protein [Desulfobacteraceae bacterium]
MSVIQIDIDDTLIQSVGTTAIKTFIEQQVAILRLQYQGEHISHIINEAGIDHDKEVSEARQEAWDEYKSIHLRDLV